MVTKILYPSWREKAVYPAEGAQPQVLEENEKFKVVVGGLEAGQKIPAHPESQGVFIFLEGNGEMTVNGEKYLIQAGATVITPDGASRGIEAETRLSFIAVVIRPVKALLIYYRSCSICCPSCICPRLKK